jgi:hypothetical protein
MHAWLLASDTFFWHICMTIWRHACPPIRLDNGPIYVYEYNMHGERALEGSISRTHWSFSR